MTRYWLVSIDTPRNPTGNMGCTTGKDTRDEAIDWAMQRLAACRGKDVGGKIRVRLRLVKDR